MRRHAPPKRPEAPSSTPATSSAPTSPPVLADVHPAPPLRPLRALGKVRPDSLMLLHPSSCPVDDQDHRAAALRRAPPRKAEP